jgi:riboflavin kinase/FMN adenylyltransferase
LPPLVTDLNDFPTGQRGGIVAIGNFDGVHRGHASIACRTALRARELGVPAVALTFDPHPAAVLRADQVPPQLAWIERRCELLGEFGIDTIAVCRTDRALLKLTPAEFFERIVVQRLGARGLVEGENFRFGRNRSGTIETLKELAMAHHVAVEVVEPCHYEGGPISSSRIRDAVAEGDVEAAAAMLGRSHRVRGRVTTGAGRGRQIGFPSANLSEIQGVLPADGVYAGRALHRSETWPAAVNVGPNPTFGESQRKVEAHLIGFSGDLYGGGLEIDFLARLRGVIAFPSVAELISQIERDLCRTREIAASAPIAESSRPASCGPKRGDR